MIISDEQVREALRYLHAGDRVDHRGNGEASPPVSDDLLKRVSARLHDIPETRGDRVSAARSAIRAGLPTSGDVADKIIGRCISDSVR